MPAAPAAGASSAWQVGAVIDGRYRVTRRLGQGGMGVVYQVRHLAWGIDLAVKSPLLERRGPVARELFVTEAETWVSLGLHPNVCNCHYVRVLDGVPRVFVECVSGGSLGDWIADGRIYRGEPRDALTRILDVAIQFAWGLEHAHSRGLVHQDVKPANVLLDLARDGVLTAKVTDFGLAKVRETTGGSAAEPLGDGTVLVPGGGGLTQAYASPEQSARKPLGRRTDVYSYAVSVLEIFAGGVHWLSGEAAPGFLATLRARRTPAASSAAHRPPPMPVGLAYLLGRCLSCDPAERPRSMAQVAAELVEIYHRTLGHPYPRPAPVASDLLADEQNNRALSLLDLGRTAEAEAAFTAALAADPRHVEATYNQGLLRWRRGELTDEELITSLETVRAESGAPERAASALAEVHLERGDVSAAESELRALGSRHNPERAFPEVPDARCVGTTLLPWYIYERKTVKKFRSEETEPAPPPKLTARLSADGRRALAECDDTVRLWDLVGGDCLLVLDRDLASHAAWLSEDGRYATAAGPDEIVRLWSLPDGRCLRTFTPRYLTGTTSVARTRISVSAGLAAAITSDGQVLLWDLASGRVRWILGGGAAGHRDAAATHDPDRYTRIDISPDGTRLLAAGLGEDSARLWELAGDPASSAPLVTLSGKPDNLDYHAICQSADGSRVAAADIRSLKVWDAATGRCLWSVPSRGSTKALSLSASGDLLLTADSHHRLLLWDVATARCLRTFPGHRADVAAVRLVDERTAVSTSIDGSARWWRLPGRYSATPLLSRPRRAAELTSADRRALALVADSRSAERVEDYEQALGMLRLARAVPGHERSPVVLDAWRSLGRSTVRTGLRGAWLSRKLVVELGRVDSAALSADGRTAALRVLTRGEEPADGSYPADTASVHIIDVETGAMRLAVDQETAARSSLMLAPDGRRVMTASASGILEVWSADTGERVSRLRIPTGAKSPKFTADGRLALLIGGDESLTLWDVASGERVRVLAESGYHPMSAVDLWLDPAGRLALSCGNDRVIRLWDLADGACLRELRGHGNYADSLTMSADRRYVLSCGTYEDRTVRLWEVESGQAVQVIDVGQSTGQYRGAYLSAGLTGDGRFAVVTAEDKAASVWDLRSGQRLREISERKHHLRVSTLTLDGCRMLSIGDGSVGLWELDWELAARESADWDPGAQPYLRRYIADHGRPADTADLDALVSLLQDAGYGWLRRSGVRARLDLMANAETKGARP